MSKNTGKECARCLNHKRFDQFGLQTGSSANRDGHDSYCKDCRRELNREYRAKRKVA